jgi:coniferyl-aldehyde dehydrogenase
MQPCADSLAHNLLHTLTLQRQSLAADGVADYATRLQRINRCIDFMVDNQDEIVAVTQRDWVHKPAEFIKAVEIIPVLNHARHIKKHLRRWLRGVRCTPDFPFNLLGAKTYVQYQPLGVIGVMVPWNGPLAMVMIAAMDAFSAGNRVMAKISELSPHTAEFLQRNIPAWFAPTELAIVAGEVDVARAFAALPFDHLMYTGSSATAKHIMAAAACNLVPVTLELGGKSPVLISPGLSDLAYAAQRILSGRLINSGQGCITPDYVLLAPHQLDDFIAHAEHAIRALYPLAAGGRDYAAIATDPHYARLHSLLREAESQGCDLRTIDVGATAARRQINPVLAINPPAGSRLLQEEIFGPILVVQTCAGIDAAIAQVNRGERPLALYYFGDDTREKDKVLRATVSGGAAVNEVMLQMMMSGLPFGGVGHSGMGAYWGGDAGFKRFSHARSVFEQGWYTRLAAMLDPPYGATLQRMLKLQLKK